MLTKQPSYYRDLLESIIQEQANWAKNVTFGYGDASIKMTLNKPIDLGDDSVVLVRMEIPLVGFGGLMGLYFMDQDHDKLERFEKDPALWAELEKAVGAALGSGTVKLGRGRDLYEPLDGGDDPCIRAILPQGMDHKLLAQYTHAVGPDGAIKLLINAIARGDFASETIEVLKSCGVDSSALAKNKDSVLKALLVLVKEGEKVDRVMSILDKLNVDWPELNAIRKSLGSSNIEESREEREVARSYVEELPDLAGSPDDCMAIFTYIRGYESLVGPSLKKFFEPHEHKWIKSLLEYIKNDDFAMDEVEDAVSMLRRIGIRWPDLDIIEKSLNS